MDAQTETYFEIMVHVLEAILVIGIFATVFFMKKREKSRPRPNRDNEETE